MDKMTSCSHTEDVLNKLDPHRRRFLRLLLAGTVALPTLTSTVIQKSYGLGLTFGREKLKGTSQPVNHAEVKHDNKKPPKHEEVKHTNRTPTGNTKQSNALGTMKQSSTPSTTKPHNPPSSPK